MSSSNPGPGHDPQRLEEGLRQLRALGYLQTPADRFVARRMPRRGGALRAAVAVGGWVGGGSGLTVAVLLWLAALLASPELIDRLGDAVLLLLQMALVLACGGALLVSPLAWLLLRWSARGGASVSARILPAVLALLAVAVAAYVSDVLGRHLLPGVARALWPGVLVALAGVAATIAASLCGLLAASVSAARWFARREPPALAHGAVTARSAQWLLGLCTALLLLAFGPYTALRPLPRLDELPRPPLRALGTGLVVVAIEGLSQSDIGELAAGAALPFLERCAREGRALPAQDGARPPAAFWNEVATGLPARVHGLSGPAATLPVGVEGTLAGLHRDPVLGTLSQRLLPGVGLGRLQAADQRELLRPPFWEIAAWAGLRALSINWWATYPAAQHPPLGIASDRWFLRLWDGDPAAATDPLLVAPADLARLACTSVAGEGLSEGAAPDLAALPDASAVLACIAQERAATHAPAEGDSLLARGGRAGGGGGGSLPRAWLYGTSSDAFHLHVASAAMLQAPRDLLVVHLNGLDVVQRRLDALAREAGGDAELVRAGLRLRELFARFLDGQLERLASAAAPRALIVLGSTTGSAGRQLWCWCQEPGTLDGVHSMWDVAPAVLLDLGLAPSREMHAPRAARMGDPALARPATYGRRPAWTPTAGRARQDLEALRSLGYIDAR